MRSAVLLLRRRSVELFALAVLLFGALLGFSLADPVEALPGLLAASVFCLTIGLGAAILIALSGVAGARWWAPVRPVAAALTRTLAVPAVALLAIQAFGLTKLYVWARPGALTGHLAGKAVWLNPPLFVARLLVVLAVWIGMTALLRERVSAVNRHDDAEARRRLAKTSAIFLLLLAPTLSVAFWDLTMSLEPAWFSTMYAVYGFSGAFLAGIAATAALAAFLPVDMPASRWHDLGKLLFAFGTFWAYIWFCQYLLIWYTNIPEETTHYAARLTGGWAALFWLNPVLSWAVPFFVLISAGAKRSRSLVAQVALVVLVGRWLDCYLLVAPAFGPRPAFPWTAVAGTLLLLVPMALVFRMPSTEPPGEAAVAPALGALRANGAAGR